MYHSNKSLEKTYVSSIVEKYVPHYPLDIDPREGMDFEAEEAKEEVIEWSKEFEVIRLMKDIGGSFVQSLAETWKRADIDNKKKLEQAFPEIWERYRKMVK